MKITIRGNGCKVKLDEDASAMLMAALVQFSSEKWNENMFEKNELSKQIGLITWLGNVFED